MSIVTVKRFSVFSLLGCCFAVLSTAHGQTSTTPPAPDKPKTVTSIDLRGEFSKYGLPIKPQGRRNTCQVFTFTGALEYALARGGGYNGLRLSEEYLNWAADEVAGEKDDGAAYEELIAAFEQWGIASERYMPYQARYNTNLVPPKMALTSAKEIWNLGFKRHWVAQRTINGLTVEHLNAMRKVLASGWPLCAYGHEHSILIVGFQDDPKMPGGGQFITRNSATQRYETIFYEASKTEFGSVLWIELPEKGTAVDSKQ